MAGTVVPLMPTVGVSLSEYPKLSAWCVGAARRRHRLIVRPSWQTTQATPEAMEAFKSVIAARMTQQNAD